MSLDINSLQISGSAIIFTDPSGATVYIDNIIKPELTPIIISDLSKGYHTYKLTLSGYKDIDGIIFISDIIPSVYIHEDLQPYTTTLLGESIIIPALGLTVGIVAAEYIIRKSFRKKD